MDSDTLKHGHFVILSGEAPRYATGGLGYVPGADGMATALVLAGFAPVPVRGRYGGTVENAYLVRVRSAEDEVILVVLARSFGQESILHGEGGRYCFAYVNGPQCRPSPVGPLFVGPEGEGFSYGPSAVPPEGDDNYSRMTLDGYPAYFTFNVG